MVYRKIVFLGLFVLVSSGLAFAEGLVAKEAVNYYNEGVKYQEAGDFPKAVIAYNKTLVIDKSYAKWIANNYGVMYVRRGNFKAAEAAFKQALKIDPNYALAELNLALLYDKLGERLIALDYWEKIFNWNAMKPKDFRLQGKKAN